MCGFAGVVVREERFRVSRETLERMGARIAHRGPDGRGLHLTEGPIDPQRPQVALVHHRLAILDPDPRSDQPFTDNQGRWIVFNGEIYNFRELRDELSSRDPAYVWRTRGDTEVLLRAFAIWGDRCVEHLNGMFAFAVWDESVRKLFCAIDRMGQKPLYWAAANDSGGAIAFASELSALGELPWFDSRIDEAALNAYLQLGYIPAPATIFRGARKFAPATAGVPRGSGDGITRYFDPNDPGDASTVHSAERTRQLVRQAVRRRLVADVPLGCFLSGGIDSSIIAAAMKAAVPPDQPVLTFSIGFDDPRYDESAYAAEVAAHLGTRHHRFSVRPDAAADLPALAAVFGEPFADSSALPTLYLARETRRHVKVALSGDGGDELFGGYDRYRAIRLAARLDVMPRALRRAAASDLWQRMPGSHPKSRVARLKRFLGTIDEDADRRHARIMRLFSDEQLAALTGGRMTPPGDEPSPGDEVCSMPQGPVERALARDRVGYLPGDVLTKVDRASMLHALEVRSPFLDPDVVRFAAGLSSDELLRGGPKRMLREAFAADLPARVFRRRKMGFAVPIGEWFRGDLRSMLHDCLFAADSFAAGRFDARFIRTMIAEHETGRADHSQRLYALLMLELWRREYPSARAGKNRRDA